MLSEYCSVLLELERSRRNYISIRRLHKKAESFELLIPNQIHKLKCNWTSGQQPRSHFCVLSDFYHFLTLSAYSSFLFAFHIKQKWEHSGAINQFIWDRETWSEFSILLKRLYKTAITEFLPRLQPVACDFNISWLISAE